MNTAYRVVPGPGAGAEVGDVGEEDGVDAVLADLGRDVAAVAGDLDVVREVAPLADEKVLSPDLAVVHLVADARVELARVGLPSLVKLKIREGSGLLCCRLALLFFIKRYSSGLDVGLG